MNADMVVAVKGPGVAGKAGGAKQEQGAEQAGGVGLVHW